MRSIRIAVLPALLMAPVLFAQSADEASAKPATDSKAAQGKDPLEALRAAEKDNREAALATYIAAQIATNAVYAGQYDALGTLGWDATPWLRKWMAAPPKSKQPAAGFQEACINALRDCVTEAPADLITELEELATDTETAERLRARAEYALAQFGHPKLVNLTIADAKKKSEQQNINQKVSGFSTLADVYYNLRRYEDAAKAHQQVIRTIESVNPHFAGLASAYYNCACSLALSGQKDKALACLAKGLQVGKFNNRQLGIQLLQTDRDISSLRSDPKFKKLMEQYFDVKPAGKEEMVEEEPPMPKPGKGKRD